MKVELSDGSIHQVPDWFRKVPVVADILEDLGDSENPIYLSEFDNISDLEEFLKYLRQDYKNLQNTLKLMNWVGWACVDKDKFTHEITVSGENRKAIQRGEFSREAVNLILEQKWEDIRDLVMGSPRTILISLILEMMLRDVSHPLVQDNFDEYLREFVWENPWVFFPVNFGRHMSDGLEKIYIFLEARLEWENRILEIIQNSERFYTERQVIIRQILPWINLIRKPQDPQNLSKALRFRSFQVAQALLNQGADVNGRFEIEDRREFRETTPLISRVRSSDLDVIEWLLDHGANVNLWEMEAYDLADPTTIYEVGEFGPLTAWIKRETYGIDNLVVEEQNIRILSALVNAGIEKNRRVGRKTFLEEYGDGPYRDVLVEMGFE